MLDERDRALGEACRLGDVAAAERLLDAGAVVAGVPGQWSPLAVATGAKGHAVMALLLARGAPVDGKADDDIGPLHHARDIKGVQLLVAAGAQVDRAGSGGTPLHHAAANASPPVIAALLKAGADVERCDEKGCTPLEVACRLMRAAAIKALMVRMPAAPVPWRMVGEFAQRAGKKDVATLAALLTVIDPDVPPMPGHGYALHLAARAGIAATVRVLLDAGAKIDRVDADGRTAVHLAADGRSMGHREVFEVLRAAGADLDLVCAGTTARALARSRGIAV